MLSVVILCYRGGKDIVPVVERMCRMLSMLKLEWELVLVGNYLPGVDDSTPAVVKELSEVLEGVRYVAGEKRGMMGWDMRSGLAAARGDYLAIIDGDDQFPVETIPSMFFFMLENGYDLVKTYRVKRQDGIWRMLLSICYNMLANMLFPGMYLLDINSKPKIMTRALYEKMRLEDDGWFIDAEIMLKANLLNAKIERYPINFYRLHGRQSFVRWTSIMEFIKKLAYFRTNMEKIRASLCAGTEKREASAED